MSVPLQDTKAAVHINPQAIVDNATWTDTEIDTLGYDYATIYYHIGATDIAMAALKVQESDTSGSGAADITGADFSTSPATLPAATDDNKIFIVHLDLRKRKRYLTSVATAGNGTAGTFLSSLCVLSRGSIGASTAALQGAAQTLTV